MLTLPHLLSLSRVVLALPAAWALLEGYPAVSAVAVGLAVASDVLDGRIARRRGQACAFGTLLDHGADAVFVTTLAAAGAGLGMLPPALPVLIALSFAHYAFDARHSAGGLRGSRLGRANGIAYFVVAGGAVAVDLFEAGDTARVLLRGGGWLLIASTLISMATRAVHLRPPRVS